MYRLQQLPSACGGGPACGPGDPPWCGPGDPPGVGLETLPCGQNDRHVLKQPSLTGGKNSITISAAVHIHNVQTKDTQSTVKSALKAESYTW